jgi:hypothetical protein
VSEEQAAYQSGAEPEKRKMATMKLKDIEAIMTMLRVTNSLDRQSLVLGLHKMSRQQVGQLRGYIEALAGKRGASRRKK